MQACAFQPNCGAFIKGTCSAKQLTQLALNLVALPGGWLGESAHWPKAHECADIEDSRPEHSDLQCNQWSNGVIVVWPCQNKQTRMLTQSNQLEVTLSSYGQAENHTSQNDETYKKSREMQKFNKESWGLSSSSSPRCYNPKRGTLF